MSEHSQNQGIVGSIIKGLFIKSGVVEFNLIYKREHH